MRQQTTQPPMNAQKNMQRDYQKSFLTLILIIVNSLVCRAFSPGHRTASSHLKAYASNNMSVDDQKMQSTYQSLAERLLTRYNRDSDQLKNNQLFVCIAGGPGSGKSTLANAVADIINNNSPLGSAGNVPSAVVLPMDGFHYTRSQLREMGTSTDCQYTYEELLARRGAEWTFDAEGCIEAFASARENGEASLPIYSREKSDPAIDGVQLQKETKIVLLEGNYLLSWKNERWAHLKSIFDESWYICCRDIKEQRKRLVKRHLETWSEEKSKMWGDGEEGAGKKADANDMLNAVWIEEMSREFADLVIESI